MGADGLEYLPQGNGQWEPFILELGGGGRWGLVCEMIRPSQGLNLNLRQLLGQSRLIPPGIYPCLEGIIYFSEGRYAPLRPPKESALCMCRVELLGSSASSERHSLGGASSPPPLLHAFWPHIAFWPGLDSSPCDQLVLIALANFTAKCVMVRQQMRTSKDPSDGTVSAPRALVYCSLDIFIGSAPGQRLRTLAS